MAVEKVGFCGLFVRSMDFRYVATFILFVCTLSPNVFGGCCQFVRFRNSWLICGIRLPRSCGPGFEDGSLYSCENSADPVKLHACAGACHVHAKANDECDEAKQETTSTPATTSAPSVPSFPGKGCLSDDGIGVSSCGADNQCGRVLCPSNVCEAVIPNYSKENCEKFCCDH